MNKYIEPDYNLLDSFELIGKKIKISMPICITIKDGLYFKEFEDKFIDIVFKSFNEFNKFNKNTIKYKDSLKADIGIILKSDYKDGEFLGTSILRYDGFHITAPTENEPIELSFEHKKDIEYFIKQLLNIKEKLYE